MNLLKTPEDDKGTRWGPPPRPDPKSEVLHGKSIIVGYCCSVTDFTTGTPYIDTCNKFPLPGLLGEYEFSFSVGPATGGIDPPQIMRESSRECSPGRTGRRQTSAEAEEDAPFSLGLD